MVEHQSPLNTAPRTALLSINDVAGYLRVTRATVYKLVAAGELQAVRVGKRKAVPAGRSRRLPRAWGAGAESMNDKAAPPEPLASQPDHLPEL